MVVNGEGEPIISFYEEQYDYLEIFRCSSSSCSSGSERILDSSTSVGYYTSIALGNDTFPVISYYDQTNGDLKLVKCTSDDCLTSKTAITLDSTGNVGSYSSIAIGSDGYPAISYYDSTNYDLKFYKCDDHNCTTGTASTLDSDGSVGGYTSIVKGADGFPIISYYSSTNHSLKLYKCDDVDCSSGTSVVQLWSSHL